ncbi:hypothetical protein D3C86_1928020 [compost metagenome]
MIDPFAIAQEHADAGLFALYVIGQTETLQLGLVAVVVLHRRHRLVGGGVVVVIEGAAVGGIPG